MGESIQKTVYFLGAGASNASVFKLPCMKDFFLQSDFISGDYSNLLKFTQKTFPGISLEELNLEEVITSLELSLDTFGSFGKHPEASMIAAKREFGEYVKNRLHIPSEGCREHKKIFSAELAASCSQDSIITLNYDLVTDNTLHELWLSGTHKSRPSLLQIMRSMVGQTQLLDGVIASIYHEYREQDHYLKLHGSIDWVYCPNDMCGNHKMFFVSQTSQDAPGDLCNLCGSPLESVIVPPTMQKTFSQFPKLGLLWNLAYRKLNKADRIVVFGVSFAPSDYYLTWLFKKAITERVDRHPTICNINLDQHTSDRIKEITGIEPIHSTNLDEFLEQAG